MLLLKNIYYSFPSKKKKNTDWVLNDLNLRIDMGEFIMLTGPSGSGKTTLLTLIGLFEKPNSGSYKLKGNEINYHDSSHIFNLRNQMFGFIFQQGFLHNNLTVQENMELPLRISGMNREKATESILTYAITLGLENRLSHYPDELSRGEIQRVAIGRCISSEPPIIIADEPTAHLDSKSGMGVIELLRDLNREFDKTVILATHDVSFKRLGFKTFELKDGRLSSN